MSRKIKDSVAIITGSNRGIGRSLVVKLMEKGAAKVYATARNTQSLEELKEKYGDRLELVTLDVTNSEQLQQVASKIANVDFLINNAGVVEGGDISAGSTLDAARKEMDVNYFGLLATSQAFMSSLQGNGGGAIVNIVSVGGLTNFPVFSTYSASKAAAHSLTQAQRFALAGQGIEVLGVYPGPVDTDMAKDLEFDKASPDSVATDILSGIENGDEEIFPDAMAREFGAQFQSSPKESERQVAAMLAG